MTSRCFVLSCIGSLLLLSAHPVDHQAFGSTGPSVLMDRAASCERRLLASSALQRLRSSWLQCIRQYEKIATAAPHSTQGLAALNRQAVLTQGLSRRSGRRQDLADAKALAARHQALTAARRSGSNRNNPATRPARPANGSPFRIVIDPGHGGKDPGAIGVGGLEEKDVVLDVAKRLRTLLSRQSRVDVTLTRSDDRFVSLEARTIVAAERRADLFISIHANSSPRRETKGLETYVLGKSSDAAAHATAERENAAPGQTAQDLDALIQTILGDLSDTTREEQSLELAHTVKESVVHGIGKRYDVVDLGIKRAPFYVLLNTGMPGILSEIAFLSNPDDARRLANPSFRQHVAEALAAGVMKYVTSPVLARSQ